MVFSILIFALRKEGTTPAEFRLHYGGIHIPLEISENETTGTNKNAKYPASVLGGSQASFEYDAFAESTFKDEAAFGTFFGHVRSGENAEKIAADEEMFLDRAKVTVVVGGDVNVTRGE